MDVKRIAKLFIVAFVLGSVAIAETKPLSMIQLAAAISRDTGWKVDASSVHVQADIAECTEAELQVVSSKDSQVVMRCRAMRLPFVVRVDGKHQPLWGPTGIQLTQSTKLLVKRGETVRLKINYMGARLSVPAVCLENGGSGARVRVRVKNTHTVRVAMVVSAGLVVEGE